MTDLDVPPLLDEPPVPDEYLPPQDLAAEMAVLGSWMLSRSAIEDCADVVTPADFYRPAHEQIARAALALHGEGEPVDAVTVADRLTASGDLARAGGAVYLHQLVGAVPVAAAAEWHARIVGQKAALRRLEGVGTRILSSVRTGQVDPLDLIEAARADLDAAADRAARRGEPSTAEDVYAAIAALDDEFGIPTPWKDLNEAIGGWRPGGLYFVGARPGKGKSVVGMCAALDAARRGHHAVIASLEMSRTEIFQRMLCHVGSVDGTHMMRRTLSERDHRALAKAATHIAGLPLTVVDDAAQRVVDIRSTVRSASRRGKVGLIVVDYLQLMSSGQRVESRQVEVAAFSRGLKLLAREANAPVIVLAQLNRMAESRHDKRPGLADLRESGSQEQDGDAVLLLHRDPENAPDVLEVLVAKHRHGPSDQVVRLRWEGQHSRAVDVPWSPSGMIA